MCAAAYVEIMFLLFFSAWTEATFLPLKSYVSMYVDIIYGPIGIPTTSRLRGEGVPGDHSTALPRRVPPCRLRDDATNFRDFPIYR